MMEYIRELLLSPRATCFGCGSVRGTDTAFLCSDCYASIVPLAASGSSISALCANCGEEYAAGTCRVCGKRKVDIVQAAAAYEYEGAIKNLIHVFKFNGVWRMSDWMANEMLRACSDDFLSGVSVVVPVPMHALRKLSRGYNQSEKLAKAFSKKTNIPYAMLLKRVRNTKQQARLSNTARRSNLKDAFKAVKELSAETVLLIDDVRTTGTTAIECVKAMLAAGAKEVRVLTFAKAIVNQNKNRKYRPDREGKLTRLVRADKQEDKF